MCCKTAPYDGMQNSSYGEKEKSRESKAKDTVRGWKLNGTRCQEAFKQEVTRTLEGKDGLRDEWEKTAEMVRKTSKFVLGVTLGKRKGDRETWWCNEEV